jgi:hypothetical protein
MELSPTVPHPAKAQYRLVVQVQKEDEQVKKAEVQAPKNTSAQGRG